MMNAKKAKLLRKELRNRLSLDGAPHVEERDYRLQPRRVHFDGSNRTVLEPMSQARIERLDNARNFARAMREGVVINWLLSEELYPMPPLVKQQVVLGPCKRSLYQRAKQSLTNLRG